MTDVRGDKYAFPFTHIEETLQLESRMINMLNNVSVVPYKDTFIRFKYLGDILSPENETDKPAIPVDINLLVLKFGNIMMGIGVDKLIAKQEIIAKPLEKQLATIKEFSGATVLGDGSIALIINTIELFNIKSL